MKIGHMISKQRQIKLTIALVAFGMAPSVRSEDSTASNVKDRIVTEAAMRLDDPSKATSNPRVSAAIERYVQSLGNRPEVLRYYDRFALSGAADRLLDLALSMGPSNDGVKAIDLALRNNASDAIQSIVLVTEEQTDALVKNKAQQLTKLLSLSNRGDATAILQKALETAGIDASVRIAAATGLARKRDGQQYLIRLAESKKLPADAATMVADSLRSSRDESIAKKANDLFPKSSSAGRPLPPIDQIAQRSGNLENGRKLFSSIATCGQCHVVKGTGKNVGPDLSEIGDKLTKEAMLVAIVNPSAGISHNYEAYSALTSENEVITGLLVSKNEREVILKDKDGIERKLAMDDIELKKLETSLMPNNLHDLVDDQGLVDIVEYMASLKKNQ